MYFNAFGVRIWVNNMTATKILDTTAYNTFSLTCEILDNNTKWII